MRYTSAYALGPGTTPVAIKFLIIVTCLTSIATALINPLFLEYLHIRGPAFLLGLSWNGLTSGYLWQPVTYLFVEEGVQGLSFGLLITLFFHMYIVWIMGAPLAERVGNFSFSLFYLAVGIVSGMITLLATPAFGQYPLLMGPTASILATWTVWTMMHPESELLFFFLLPIKAKWLLAAVFSALLLVNLSQADFARLVFHLSAGLVGYFYAVLAWNMEGPFLWMSSIDNSLLQIKSWASKKDTSLTKADDSKVIDIHTGKPFLDDDAFVDAMLAKISEKGEHSLTWSERRRLRKISEKKQY